MRNNLTLYRNTGKLKLLSGKLCIHKWTRVIILRRLNKIKNDLDFILKIAWLYLIHHKHTNYSETFWLVIRDQAEVLFLWISALVSILKLGGRLLITFFEIFQIKYSYVVNSKKVEGQSPPLPPSNEGPAQRPHWHFEIGQYILIQNFDLFKKIGTYWPPGPHQQGP